MKSIKKIKIFWKAFLAGVQVFREGWKQLRIYESLRTRLSRGE